MMATRLCFISRPDKLPVYEELPIEFQFYSGFSLSQKQKSIASLHDNIHILDSSFRVLEISTKSMNSLGVALSAFNLAFFDKETNQYHPIENIFQSSKVFEQGGPFRDLLNVSPRDAKRDERLRSSGKLIHFEYNKEIWDLEPKSMFYDWLYINSLAINKQRSENILSYNAFTDIEFNQAKSINCQARSAAIFVSLRQKHSLINEILENIGSFRNLYEKSPTLPEQMMFDLS
jgi:type I restriction enzyme M protein